MNFRIFDSVDDLLHAAARTIVQRVKGRDRCSIALSGGSTPVPLYEMLGRSPLRDELAPAAITWAVVDERYVPFDDPQSNAGMIERTLFAEGLTPGHRFLPFRTQFADPHESAAAYEREWRELGLDALDIVVLGIGDDGHTASLFPGTEALDVEDRIAVAHFVPKLDMWRVTITKPVIRAAALRLVIAAGASKRPILDALKAGNTDYPIAQATAGAAGETWWLVDRAAGGE
jgi:6-phosphogluconolactonase